ncbi:MAG: hypothetical protein WAW88_04750 [Nocardioides sp.]
MRIARLVSVTLVALSMLLTTPPTVNASQPDGTKSVQPFSAEPLARGKWRVSINVNRPTVITGQMVTITGRVAGAKRQKVVLQKRYRKHGRWIKERTARTDKRGNYVLRDRPTTLKTRWYRVVKPSSNRKRMGASKVKRVRVQGWRGNVHVELTWQNEADLDLHVVEPDSTEIWYSSPGPTWSGGYLSYDENVGCGYPDALETVSWPTGYAPQGTYYAWVDVYSDCGYVAPAWTLRVYVNGRLVKSVSGSGDSRYFVFGGSTGGWRALTKAEFERMSVSPKSTTQRVEK